MARLLIKCGSGQGHALELRPGITRLGRDASNHFQLDDPTVSGRHCEVELGVDQVVVRDLGSTNGTLVSGQRVTRTVLKYGQSFQLGALELELAPDPVAITLPQVDFAEPAHPTTDAEGKPVCFNHPGEVAKFICAACGKQYCQPCIHMLRRVGGHMLVLCPICSGKCRLLPGQATPPPPRSIFGRLRQRLFKRTTRWVHTPDKRQRDRG